MLDTTYCESTWSNINKLSKPFDSQMDTWKDHWIEKSKETSKFNPNRLCKRYLQTPQINSNVMTLELTIQLISVNMLAYITNWRQFEKLKIIVQNKLAQQD